MRRKRRLWPLMLVLPLLAGGGVWLYLVKGGQGSKGVAVDPSLVTKVGRGDLEISVTELGRIEPREKVAVKSRVAGQAMKVLIEEGEHVHKGQLLLYLDPIDFVRNVTRAEQEVQKADTAVELADITARRRRKGLADRGVSQADVDLADNELRTKKIALSQARESLAAARDQLRFSRIVAPLDGTITQCTIRPGETVVPGIAATLDDRSLLVVSDLSVLLAKADLNQIDVAKVKLGQSVTLTLDALPGRVFKARVTKIAPASILPKGKDVEVFPIEATLAPEGIDFIKPGMTADVKVHVETRHDVLRLPIEAVVKEKNGAFVNRVVGALDSAGKARVERVKVELGARNDREQELLHGVAAGDRVLIRPPSADANEWK
jgi:membrane fusion protein, macrolide-specific efflux system